ncbi:MAG: hypothetical protein ABUT39_17755 [Acidobacteriota bacterium]
MKPATGVPADRAALRALKWWAQRYDLNDKERQLAYGFDPKDLASSGWGVLFASDVGEDVRSALEPLLKLRRQQAGDRFKPFEWSKPQTKQQFLAAHGAAAGGPANPTKIPYYLLIVGDPKTIPFRFQYDLDVPHAVGRLHLKNADDYASYARSVVDAETGNGVLPRRPRREVALFGVCNPDDPATYRTLYDLIEPLAKVVKEELKKKPGWDLREFLREDATKAQLARLLGGGETPSLLFTASHGMRFPIDDKRFPADQGALLCQDWPGPIVWGKKEIPRDFYFSGADVGDQSLLGLIAFFLACHSAGSPDLSDFDEYNLAEPTRIAPAPFLADLPSRLLSHPCGGALAVVGHIDRAWTISFGFSESGQTEVYDSLVKCLLDGHPIGFAMEYVNQTHAALSADLSQFVGKRALSPNEERRLNRTWQANNDARNFVVLGDPAVRLMARPD